MRAQAQAQAPSFFDDLAVRLAAMTAVTGYEQAAVDTIIRWLPGARRDRAGNAVLVIGAGAPRRLVVCPLDEPGYVVSGIRADGYLTVRVVPLELPRMFDRQFVGQRVTVFGAARAVPGVVAVPSIHLEGQIEPFRPDDMFVDVGATSAAAARRAGARILAPVALAKRPQRYGRDLVAAPSAGQRLGCAALLAAAREVVLARADAGGARPAGTVVVAFSVGQRMQRIGVRALGSTLGPFQETLSVLQPGTNEPTWAPFGQSQRRLLPVRYAGTPVETAALGDADSLRRELVRWIAGTP